MKIEIGLQSTSASKKQQDNAKILFGAKGKTLIAALDELAKVKRKLSPENRSFVESVQDLLKLTLDEKTIARLKKRKGMATLPTAVKNLAKARTSHHSADMLQIKNGKSRTAVGNAMFKLTEGKDLPKPKSKPVVETAKALFGGKANSVIKNMAKLKPLNKKFGLSDDGTFLPKLQKLLGRTYDPRLLARLQNNKAIAKIPELLADLVKVSPKYFKASDELKAASKGLPAFTKLFAGEVAKAQGATMDKKSETAAKKVAKTATKKVKGKVKVALKNAKTQIEDEGIAKILNVNPEFLKSIYKGAAMKNIEHDGAVTNFEAKGAAQQVAERFVIQLRKKPEFRDSMLALNSDDDFYTIALNDGTGNSIRIEPVKGGAGKYLVEYNPNPGVAEINSDGKTLYVAPNGLNKLSAIRSQLQSELMSHDSKVKAQAKRILNQYDKIETQLESGMSRQKFKTAYNKLPNDIQDQMFNALPKLAEFSQY